MRWNLMDNKTAPDAIFGSSSEWGPTNANDQIGPFMQQLALPLISPADLVVGREGSSRH